MYESCQNDAAKKMAQRPNRASRAESRSQAENLILSGWQGSDEDEDVKIDSSDDEKVRMLNHHCREFRLFFQVEET